MVPVRPADDPDDALQAVMRGLAVSAREANLARTAVLEASVAALAAGPLTAEQRGAAVSAAHQVVGSAGTFGWHRSSAVAAELEQWFRDGPTPGDPDRMAWADARLAELRADLTGAHQDEG